MPNELVSVGELKVGDVLVGVGKVASVGDYSLLFKVPQWRVSVVDADENESDLWVPPTFLCRVERKPKVWRRTIVLEAPTSEAFDDTRIGGHPSIRVVSDTRAVEVDA